MPAIHTKTGRRVVAVDMHVHPNDEAAARSNADTWKWAGKHFRQANLGKVPLTETAAEYRELNMMCVLLALDKESATGNPAVSSEHVAEAVTRDPDVLVGMGSVDPYKGKYALKEVERCKQMGLKGMKFQQITQAFDPSEHRFYPIWEACEALGMIVLFHMGTTGIGSGAPGGLGLRLEYGRPLLIDRIAGDFPGLKIICAHPAWPWHEEGLAVVQHKGNVHMDLSGYAPKYIAPSVLHYARTLLQDKVMFGSDSPLINPKRWIEEFKALNFPPEVQEKILWKNAAKLFALELEEEAAVS